MKSYYYAVGINLATRKRGFLVAPPESFLNVGDVVETTNGRYRILFSCFHHEESDLAAALSLYSGGFPEKITKRIIEEEFEWKEEAEDVSQS